MERITKSLKPIHKKAIVAGAVLIILSVAGIIVWQSVAVQKRRSHESMLIMQSVMDTLKVESYFRDDYKRRLLHKQLIQFYNDRDYQLAWNTLKKPLPQTDSLLEAIRLSYQEGLEPDDYNFTEIKNLQESVFQPTRLIKKKYKKPDLLKLVQLDFYTTAAYLTYASHLKTGRIDPSRLDTNWISKPVNVNLARELAEAVRGKRIKRSLAALLPQQEGYHQLKNQLAHFRAIAEKGGWPVVRFSKPAKKGSNSEEIAVLKKWLALNGDLDQAKATQNPTIFDTDLENALKKFQDRHGLAADGKINSATLEAMNVPIEKRMDQIALNMERFRWLPDNLGKQYVTVNVPEFKLRVFKNDKKTMEMRVIVGREFSSTPIFSDTIEYIVMSPTWTVPKDIVVKEMLPIIQRNPQYLLANNFEVFTSWDSRDSIPLDSEAINWDTLSLDNFTYRVVQKPGENNSLGLIKFMLPNKMDIYLHDTPADYLFDQPKRAFSHGCIRLEKPAELAAYLLDNEKKWNEETITKAMHQDHSTIASLPEKVPVRIMYSTAWMDEFGRMNFRKDIYGYDVKQVSAIRRKSKQL
jgi:murein L,D-transpeptidase YcbB/YkuD